MKTSRDRKTKIIIQLTRAALIFCSVIFLSGCLDAGLEMAARRQQKNNQNNPGPENVQAELAEVDPEQTQTQESNFNKQEVEAVIEEIFQDIKQALEDSNPKNNSPESDASGPQLISCDIITNQDCGPEPENIVCAKLKFTTPESETFQWLEFKNACLACQNKNQTQGQDRLEALGFILGQCPRSEEL